MFTKNLAHSWTGFVHRLGPQLEPREFSLTPTWFPVGPQLKPSLAPHWGTCRGAQFEPNLALVGTQFASQVRLQLEPSLTPAGCSPV